jgi:hypothetical protein
MIVPEFHVLAEAGISPFVLRLHLQTIKHYMQARILRTAPRKDWSHPVFLHLHQLGSLSGCSSIIARLLEEQILNMRVPQGQN